ncbi:5'-nucleotidase C-terminal domain-containing protein [Pararhodobacter sp. SW119]|uniref:bifunctional metallophosphatase/5'-nucleotidase n=1 Tax=Pararhodobacter sp. SW119 TaxID=2780075 RepID=UPI001AE07121|nr:5'-nucleotidase C-terminal domain-containing protein [Pararhodobacter sp. SW119]
MPRSPFASPAPSRRRFLQIAGSTMLVTGAGVFSMASARAGTGTRLHVLHINDMHSRLEEISGSDATCSPTASAEGSCFGGAPRLAGAIRARREELGAEGVPVLTLDAGDQSQGTLFYTTYRGKAEVEIMNMIGFDAMTLGNHEFNNGPDALAEMLAEAAFPIVAGNVVVPEGHPLKDLVRDHLIVEAGAARVGILGITTPDTVFLSSPEPVTFENETLHLEGAVARLREAGVNRIIVLSHMGFVQDQRIAAAVEGISLIIGGHSHTLLSNTVEGTPDYATMVEAPDGRAVPIVQAYAFSRYLGDLSVEFDEDGAVIAAEGDTVLLDASFEPAEDVATRVAALAGPIEELKRTEIAEVAASIDGSRESCRAMECEMGNSVTNAMLERVGNPAITIALTNGGGLRASLEAGMVTVGDVLTVLPFQNTLYTMQVPGRTLVAALEHGVNGIEEGAGRFPQVAGMRFRLDTGVAPNAGRVSGVEVATEDGWVPIDPEANYGLVTNNFMARGGDGYAMLASDGQEGYDTAIDMADALAEYLARHAPYSPAIEGRITQ